MNLMFAPNFQEQYKKTLSDCLTSGSDEDLLSRVYELGRQAFRDGLGLSALVELHHSTLHQLMHERPGDPARIFREASAATVELFAPYQSEIARLQDYQVAQDSLNAKLRQQTRQLDKANEELKVARTVAETAANTKAEFLAHMSHEIRTPLNAIIGMAGLLVETELGGQQRDFAETIRSSGDHLLTIINDILDFSKIEAGKIDLEVTSFRLSQCVEDCLDLVAARAAEKGINIGYFIESDVPRVVEGDIGRVRQVLLNLLSNAVKFTSSGEVTVHVSGKRTSESDSYEVRFAVRDTGAGIAKHQQNRLFQPFSQMDASTTRIYGGTGLGLSISWRLVKLLGGTMWVESDLGAGSTFCFTIQVRVSATSEAMKDPLDARTNALAGHRVLIVDGNATNRRILSAYMRMWNLVPVEATTTAEALALIAKPSEALSLVLVEYELEGMTAVEFAQLVRNIPGRADLAMVLFCQTTRKPNDISQAGFHGYLSKPIKPSTLHNVVIDVLLKQRNASMSPPTSIRTGPEVPLRILIAEDNSVNQKVAMAILGRLGYTADIVGNGREAVAAIELKPYDVVLMDVQMPEMDGLTATQEVCRRFSPLQRPHIVGLTANVTEEARRQCLAAGMDSYVSKPVTIAKLAELLHRCTPRALRTQDSVEMVRPEVPLEAPKPAPVMDNAQVVFWQTQARERGIDLETVVTRIGEAVWQLRHAADRGDHAKGQTAARTLQKLVAGGAPSEVTRKILALEESSSESFLRTGISAVAELQLDVEKLQATIRSVPSQVAAESARPSRISQDDFDRFLDELGGKEIGEIVVNEFLREAQRLVEVIGRAILEGETGEARAAAHSLKGACSALPVPKFRDAAEAIESALKAGNLDGLPELWSTLADQHGRSAAMLVVAMESLN